MQRLFLKPLGTIRELGTPSQLAGDAITLAAWAAIIIALILL